MTVQAASVAGQGNIIVQASGSARVSVNARIAIEPRVPHLVLTDFEARTQLVRGDASNDAALLSPYRTDVVPLLGRDDMLADLQHWLDVSRPISVRVMTGGAGRGKTRLAIELVRKATALKWFAGFATDKELDRFRGQQNVARWGWDKPTLVVIDYAASRVDQLRDWFGELVDTQAADRPGLRILLLERQAQCEIGWLQVVIGHGQDDASHAVRALLDPPEPRELPPVDDLAIRRRIYGTLLERDRADLSPPEPGIDPEFDRLLRDEKWSGDPLFLMMAGLVAGERGVRDVLTLSRADLAITVAQREFKRIGNIAARAGVDATHRGQPGFLLRHVAVAATLRQGLRTRRGPPIDRAGSKGAGQVSRRRRRSGCIARCTAGTFGRAGNLAASARHGWRGGDLDLARPAWCAVGTRNRAADMCSARRQSGTGPG